MYRETPKKVVANANVAVRTKAMKSLEEAYGVKYETPVAVKMNQKSQIKCSVATANAFKDRGDMDYTEAMDSYRPNYNKYLITSSDRYGGMKLNDGTLHTTRRKAVTFHSEHQHPQSNLLEQRHAEVLSKQEQYFGKVEKPPTRVVSSKPKTARGRQGNGDDIVNFHNSNMQTNITKKEDTFVEGDVKKNRMEHRHHQHKHEHQHQQHEMITEDKDDDTEEFIGLIKRAVEKSVVKSMSEILSSTFSDMIKRMDRQTAEVKKLTTLVQKLHNNLGNKIAHYGEENSRHFRYLCMKSEYDKMFYQHHNQMTVKSAPTTPPTPNKHMSATARSMMNTGKSCSVQSARTLVPDQDHQQCQHFTLAKKSMDDGLRDMVAQLKRFCTQYESTVILEEDMANKSGTSGSSGLRLDNAYTSRVHLFQDDDTNVSSDGMTPRSVENGLSAMDRKRSKTSLATETLNSLNESSIGGGDA